MFRLLSAHKSPKFRLFCLTAVLRLVTSFMHVGVRVCLCFCLWHYWHLGK